MRSPVFVCKAPPPLSSSVPPAAGAFPPSVSSPLLHASWVQLHASPAGSNTRAAHGQLPKEQYRWSLNIQHEMLPVAYRANMSVDDAVNMGLHFILQHLDRPETYVKILFVDFSSVFNTIIPDTLQNKMIQLSVPTSVCQWITSFLTDRQTASEAGKILIQHPYDQHWSSPHCSSPCIPTTAHLKTPLSSSWSLQMTPPRSASFRTVTSLLTDRRLRSWLFGETPCSPPLTIMNSSVTAVESFRFLGTTISQDLMWDNHIESMVKKAQQRLHFLHQLRKFNLPQELLKQFYSAIESVLCMPISVWFSSASKSDLRRLLRVVRTAERIIGTTLPTLQELYLSRVSKRAGKITLDPSQPAHSLFELLPSGQCYRAPSTRTYRHRNSFFPHQTISWTLDIKRGTHNTIIQLFIYHTYLFVSFQICTLQTSHIIVCIVYCVFAILYIAYLYIVILLSVSCPVILLHVGASVTITNSSYV